MALFEDYPKRGQQKRRFTVAKLNGDELELERDSVMFIDGWVVFANGGEYQYKTDYYAIPAQRVLEVFEQIPESELKADNTPVAPPLRDKDAPVKKVRADGLVYDADDDEYHEP